MVVHQRGVQVDGVRHHGGAQNRGGHQHRVGALEAWNHAFDHFAGVRRGYEQTRDEAECDNQQHHDDDALECGLCLAALEPQHHRGDCADHQTADEFVNYVFFYKNFILYKYIFLRILYKIRIYNKYYHSQIISKYIFNKFKIEVI